MILNESGLRTEKPGYVYSRKRMGVERRTHDFTFFRFSAPRERKISISRINIRRSDDWKKSLIAPSKKPKQFMREPFKQSQ